MNLKSKMRRIVVFLIVAISAGCARQQMVWQRFDGQSVHASPALEQQGVTDLATCRALAINAGNTVQQPAPAPRFSVSNNVNMPVYVGPGPIVALPPPPPSYEAPQVDFSGLADAGASIGTGIRRSQTEQANMQACMAQRGYQLVAAPPAR
jgi:hypothetical protein